MIYLLIGMKSETVPRPGRPRAFDLGAASSPVSNVRTDPTLPRIGVEKRDREVCPQRITVEESNVQIIPGSLIGLPLKGTTRVVAFVVMTKAPFVTSQVALMIS